jgi:hypothetical protein
MTWRRFGVPCFLGPSSLICRPTHVVGSPLRLIIASRRTGHARRLRPTEELAALHWICGNPALIAGRARELWSAGT